MANATMKSADPDGTLELAVEEGALTEVPIYEGHKRGKNWFARIEKDPAAPGGLGREFARSANGDYYYMLPDWAEVGTPVEFGADYYSGGGRKNPRRTYAVVTGVGADLLVLQVTDTSGEAFELAEELAVERDDDEHPSPFSRACTELEAGALDEENLHFAMEVYVEEVQAPGTASAYGARRVLEALGVSPETLDEIDEEVGG